MQACPGVSAPFRVQGPEPAPRLRTARMELRPLRAEDRERFLHAVRLSVQHLARFSPLHRPGESDEALFDRQLRLSREGLDAGIGFRLIGVTDDERVVGAFNLNAITRGLTFRADCNWWVSAEFTGAGYATEGLSALLGHAGADLPGGLGLFEVSAYINRVNASGIRLARKVGFVRAGEDHTYLRMGDRWELHDLWVRRL
jgi:RimJ/RimL family protein N-acetyltransferase